MPKGIFKNPELRIEKIRKVLLGKKLSIEHRKNLSESHKGLKWTEKRKKNLSIAIKGRKLTEEWKKKIGDAHRGKKKNYDNWLKGKKMPELMKEKVIKNLVPFPKGYKPSKETLKKAYISRMKNDSTPKKDKHYNWKGGISKRPYPFEFDNKLKELIRERDNYKCQLCGCPQEECVEKLCVHHIDYNKDNLDPKNLITLCRGCNCKVNYGRNKWIEHFSNQIA